MLLHWIPGSCTSLYLILKAVYQNHEFINKICLVRTLSIYIFNIQSHELGLFIQVEPIVNYTICFKKAILSKEKNRFNQDYYSKTYNQNYFLLYFIFQNI